MLHRVGEPEMSAFPRISTLLVSLLQAIIAVEVVLLVIREHFLSAFMASGVLMLPVLFRKIPLKVPTEVQLTTIVFAFVSLFLGEVQDYYERFWWWDLSIHFSSGLLLGLFGFILVYMMNENSAVDFHMRRGFVALFAFFFAVAVGAVWEVFEFAVDQIFGTSMQKPRSGDPSGLTDTMWDMSLDILGAAITTSIGWYRIETRRYGWLRRFVRRNPQLFGDQKGRRDVPSKASY